ncbi:thioesterase family protein [Noviherbaspirillum sp. CPCC 100848]|uniref:Thioesterase family protein n=1 Tax=Noviherbaspirillum album TaxID=3080276 RepID=A0ABU6JHD1_9BURK|nr:thioesterase family protein [Noviherbaspirillum sp. CPCC 100848]MEC4723062.1 thioesterase family protein [Noviherbaspirillum sp. CPCC 100848]
MQSMQQNSKPEKPSPLSRKDFRHFLPITTRWMDNDAYGHVNNVVYYSWFDTVVNQFLITRGVLDLEHSQVIGLVIETQCNYFASVAFPEQVTAGLRVSKLGNSSVRYEVGIFRGDEEQASAQGHFVHVYVDRTSRKPTALPDDLRNLLRTVTTTAE